MFLFCKKSDLQNKARHIFSRQLFNLICCSLLVFLGIFFTFSHSLVYSAPIKSEAKTSLDNPNNLFNYLSQEKNYLSLLIIETKKHLNPHNILDFDEQMQKIAASTTMIDAKIESLQSLLVNQKMQSIELNQKLKYLQQSPSINAEKSLEARVARVDALLTINNQTIDLISGNINLANQFKVALSDQVQKLNGWKIRYNLEQKLQLIKRERQQLNKQLDQLYFNSLSKQQLGGKKTNQTDLSIKNQIELLINNQHIALINYQLNTLKLRKKALAADIILLNSADTKSLQTIVDVYKDCINQYSSIAGSLQQMLNSLNKEARLVTDPSSKKLFSSLEQSLKLQAQKNASEKNELIKGLDNYQSRLKKLISSRQSLSEYNLNSWPAILSKILSIPNQFYKYVTTLSLKVYDSYGWLTPLQRLMLWGVLLLNSMVFILLARAIKLLRNTTNERSRLTGYLFEGLLIIIQRNFVYLWLYATLRIVLYYTSISFANYQLLINLIIIWFIFRVLILISRLVLLERISDSSGKDVKLYYRLKWLFQFGGWSSALMVFSHLLPLPMLLQDLFNRLLMLFILAISLVTWKSKDVIFYLLHPLLAAKKRYVKNAVSLLVQLLPITLLSTAVVGLWGLVSLAWVMSGYQVYTLLVLVAYILARGLLFDALELVSEWMIASLNNGWLWIEVFLKPLDKILRIVLLMLSVFAIFQVFGWHSDSLVMLNLSKIAGYTIINFPGVLITVTSVIEFFIVLSLFIWAAKWTREFCYRWLYKNAKDAGIRNSLSIFTQYTVILLGVFITLHVLGFDLSGMSMILGGLAVGMGLGLKDFASNIVGGIMLLIERPVREGDLITLGEHEGRVAHIGIRSMRVSSWDNMEVLIPNAETFNKPFTNWTLQDSIIRTVFPIKVCRSDDPVMVQQLVLDVLAIIPEIEMDPPAQVLLKKIDDALMEFEVRYFINIEHYSRVEVRSKVLFAITAQFKAAGIKPPIEPVSIEIKERFHESDKKDPS